MTGRKVGSITFEGCSLFYPAVLLSNIQYHRHRKGINLLASLLAMARITPQWVRPSHPHLLEVIDEPGAFASLSRSLVARPPGALLARIAMPPLTVATKAYSTVQVSRTQHVELNCDFLFANHSCEPSVEFHVLGVDGAVAIEVRVAARRDHSGNIVGLQKGDDLTFFYPSTEWDMAQPFECNCGTDTCRKWIAGAKDMGSAKLQGLFLNHHIHELLEEQKGTAANGSAEINKAFMPGLFGGAGRHFGEVGGRRGISARALAGEMGGDTQL
jgi:hypothetical protein